ncbi:MAG: hypothetical protein J6T82_03305 [Bacteroidaceae bacterium]|nr:hypothetical protein [Bacteroidaceae bacterium]
MKASAKKNQVKELTERQKVILEIIAQNPFIAAKAVAEKVAAKTAVTDKTVMNDITRLKQMGILSRKGSKDSKWVIAEKEA